MLDTKTEKEIDSMINKVLDTDDRKYFGSFALLALVCLVTYVFTH